MKKYKVKVQLFYRRRRFFKNAFHPSHPGFSGTNKLHLLFLYNYEHTRSSRDSADNITRFLHSYSFPYCLSYADISNMLVVGRLLPLLIIDVTSFIPRMDTMCIQPNLETLL